MNTRTSKVRKRARLAMAVLAGALVLPGLAAADHFECEPGSTSNACGKFDPQLIAGAEVPFTDTISTLTFRFNQKDEFTHDQPVLGVTYLAPKGWQFAVNSLRASQVSEGGHADPVGTEPATNCTEVFTGDEVHNDDDSARLRRADNLSGNVGASANIANSRSGDPIDFGYARQGPNEGSGDIRNQNPSLAFLGWDSVTEQATLCLYLYANTERVAETGVTGSECGLLGAAFSCTVEREEARQHLIPITMSKVQPGELLDGEDISTDFGWKFDFDLTSFYGHELLRQEEISLLDVLVNIQAQSGGNWHINDVTGLPESIVFSKTPKVAGDYEFRGIFSTCAEGFNATTAPTGAAAESLSVSDLCENGALHTTTRSVFQKILNPPSANVLDFGKLTGPAGDISINRFGLIRGTNDVTFSWSQPTVPLDETIKGYVLTIAEPGNQDSRHFEYLITNPADGGFDTREPCGPAGDEGTCSLTVTFPLSTIGPDFLSVNGKYDAALITLYEGTNGATDKRSDGLCDDGTGFGTDCPLTDPAFRIDIHRSFDLNRVPGISIWQFMLREKEWPVAFVQPASVSRSGGGPSFQAPRHVLLVDFDLRQAEFVLWNALGFEEPFFASSNTIIGDNSAGGVVSFQSSSMTGHTANWRFDGRILPFGGSIPNAPFISPDPFFGQPVPPDQAQVFTQAYGLFVRYDLKGLPGAIPPGGMPTAQQITFLSNTPV